MSDHRRSLLSQFLTALVVLGITACSTTRPDSVLAGSGALHPADIAHSHIDVVRTTNVPTGTIEGVVVNAMDGASLARAIAVFAGTKEGVVVDSLGRFKLTSSSKQLAELVFEHIGFEPGRVKLDLGLAGGFVVKASLMPDPPCFMLSRPSVVVIVRDIRTGKAPLGRVTLTARAGSVTMSDSAEALRNENSAVLSVPGWHRGIYDLDVSGKEYTSWHRAGVSLPTMDCSVQTFYAWLLPAGNRHH